MQETIRKAIQETFEFAKSLGGALKDAIYAINLERGYDARLAEEGKGAPNAATWRQESRRCKGFNKMLKLIQASAREKRTFF